MGSHTRARPPGLTAVALSRATAADLPEVVALERTAYGDPWPASAFATLPGNGQVYFAVARAGDGRLAGYVVGWYVLEEGEVANLAVAADLRTKGVGGLLLDAMLEDAALRGTRHLFLEVRASNQAARRLYARRGFEEVGRRKGYYRMPTEDALILRRTLDGS